MKLWIVWLPNVWKSTIFNALLKSYSAESANFPFCTIQPNIWIVDVKDERVDKLAYVSNSKNKVYATLKIVDIAWLVKWAHKGLWLWNEFLNNIREVDGIAQVVRYFKDSDIIHVEWNVDPLRDINIINEELIFSDLEIIERNIANIEKKAKNQDKNYKMIYEAFIHFQDILNQMKFLYWNISKEEILIAKQYWFLTSKPLIYLINIWEDDLDNYTKIKKEFENKINAPIALTCWKLEYQLIDFSDEERKEFLKWVSLDEFIKLAFDTLWLMYFFTSGEKETKAWVIEKWATAYEAAWKIHSDIQRGFIKAEVVNWQKFVEYWWWSKLKEKWLIKLEWKDYIIQDWDVVYFRFNV